MSTNNAWNNTISDAATTFNGGDVDIATDAAEHTVTIGNTTGATAVDINIGTGDFTMASASGTLVSQLDTGEMTRPLQPAFLAQQTVAQNNITGNGTTATINYTTEIFDNNGDYDGTNAFTAPVTGRYFFSGSVLLGSVSTATIGSLRIETSNRTYLYPIMNYDRDWETK